jgi:hypothetical protein
MFRCVLISIFIMAFSSSAVAAEPADQGGASSPEGNSNVSLERECQSCLLTTTDQETIKGRFLKIASDSLFMEAREEIQGHPFEAGAYNVVQRSIPMRDVSSLQCGDPNYDGIFKGALWGGLPVSLMAGFISNAMLNPNYTYTGHPVLRPMGYGLLIGGGVGALVGYLIDSAVGHPVEEVRLSAVSRD